jgi:hypothetical protein
MRHFSSRLRLAFLMACACVFFLPRFAAAAERPIAVDFDGDGQHDRLTVDQGHERSVLRVWLSGSNTTQLIHTRVAVLKVIAVDLDGDHRPELIARDSQSQLRVWTRRGERFHFYRPRVTAPLTLSQPHQRSVRDDSNEPLGETLSTVFAPLALALCASPRAPGLEGFRSCALHSTPAYRSFAAVAPFAPRPPPALILS